MISSIDYFQLADELLQNSSPIKIRTAVNRLYYGVLHLIMERYNFTPPSKGTHKKIKLFVQNFSFNSEYNNLYDERVIADYYHHKKVDYRYAISLKKKIYKIINIEIDSTYHEEKLREEYREKKNHGSYFS